MPSLPRLALLLLLALPTAAARAQDAWRDQDAVNRAIDRGVAHLLRRQCRDGSWGPEPIRAEAHFDQRSDQTALSLYTLLKCQLPPDHPAVRRGVAYLLGGEPRTTYSISVQLMALATLHDDALLDRVERLAELLASFQRRADGVWGYPTHGSVQFDLSNTQYAALGLRAAQQAGARVRDRLWEELLEGALAYQQTPWSVDGGPELAGFSYDPWDARAGKGTRGHGVTGSMTAAGVCILRLAHDALAGRYKRSLQADVERAMERGVAWLGHHFAVDRNPGGSASWHDYYLYGLERVGSLLGVERIGAHDWYWEGARDLVARQGADGQWKRPGNSTWPPEPMGAANTCFALLFLVRATAPVSGGSPVGEAVHALEGEEHAVWLRGAGRGKLAVWVSGFSERARDDHAGDLRVREVVWLVDGEAAARVPGDPGRPWRDERYAVQHRFERAGPHRVEAVVVLAGGDELRSGALEVSASDVLEDWMLAYAKESGPSRWHEARLALEASSQEGPHAPGRVADGLQFTSWIPKGDDATPTLRFQLSKAVRAERLALCQAAANELEARAPVLRVSLLFNRDREPIEVTLDPDPRRKTYVEIPRSHRSLRALELRILERGAGAPAGLAEVQLLP